VQQAPQLHLAGRSTRLSDDDGWNEWNDSPLEPYPMLCPNAAIASFSGDEYARVVDDGSHARSCPGATSRSTRATLRRCRQTSSRRLELGFGELSVLSL